MREIKFRVWHKKYKEHFNIMELQFTNNGKISNIMLWNDEHTGAYFRVKNIDDIILEPYTGREDKNGSKIYVGHLLAHEDYDGLWEVVYLDDAFRLKHSFDNLISNHVIGDYELDKMEVSGNIHENGDLLK